ncbi:MAG: ATP-binding cassette domain-containing protein [Anaerolineae bacterium]|nr:ATP-binding cassette domain-containing protein [Anaerolineae bacterium]
MLTIEDVKVEPHTNHLPTLVSVEHLTRKFGSFTAVNDISFQVNEGEIFGFLGPNGAGKSTTIKIMCTLLRPSAGHIRIAGVDVTEHPDQVRSAIGIVFQDNSLDSGLTALENLRFHCMMYHIPQQEREQRIENVLKLMDLTDVKDRIVKAYSGGMRRRLEIARGLLHNPRLLILDEPTVGLDPQTRNYIWQYVRQLRERHHTAIFMTTHYMDEAENCDRIAVIDKGVIVALDTPTELKKLVGEDRVELTTKTPEKLIATLAERHQIDAAFEDGKVLFQVAGSDRFVPQLLVGLSQAAEPIIVETLSVRRPTLEDVFLKLTGRTIRDEEGGKDERKLTARRLGRL